MTETKTAVVEQELDGTTIEYEEIPVEGDRVERLTTELFTEHWAHVTVGPLVQDSHHHVGEIAVQWRGSSISALRTNKIRQTG